MGPQRGKTPIAKLWITVGPAVGEVDLSMEEMANDLFLAGQRDANQGHAMPRQSSFVYQAGFYLYRQHHGRGAKAALEVAGENINTVEQGAAKIHAAFQN